MDRFLEFIMNHYLLAGSFLVVLSVFIFFEVQARGSVVSIHELVSLVNTHQAVVIDIRTHKEYAVGHITGSLNIPMDKIKEREVELVKFKDKIIILVDELGAHASSVSTKLIKDGFHVVRLRQGLSAWKAESFPLVRI